MRALQITVLYAVFMLAPENVQSAALQTGPANESPGAAPAKPACPPGWIDFRNPILGLQAHVPTNYWVRLRGGGMFTVENQSSPATMSFMVPLRPRAGAAAAEIAERFAKFVAESEPRLKAQPVGQPTPDRAICQFTSFASGQPVEGKYSTLLAAGGTTAFVIGVAAPQGQLEQELPTLRKIAESFGFEPPKTKWINYESPAGGFTMTLPQGWQVQSGDGQSSKDDIDWAALDPQRPLSRAFQSCPRYCSPQLLNNPLHVMRGFRPAQFQSHQQIVVASLAQLAQNVKLVKWNVNQELTAAFRRLNQQLAQMLSALNAGRTDITVYDCLAQVQLEGKPVVAAFIVGIQTTSGTGAMGIQLTDWRVTLRGWCAPPEQFVADSPVLEKICSSMQLSAAFLNRILNSNERATAKIRETQAYVNKVHDQIRQSHWDTMDAIAEMNYDTLRESGGYVNEHTGRIEQIPSEKLLQNSHGEYVSRDEVDHGVSLENATVLRGAHADDYMRGVYGRIGF